jgi:hypothetical protein
MQLDDVRLRPENQKQEKSGNHDDRGANNHFVQVGPRDQPNPT